MKRLAIVTIESSNYGNRLQNYALQEVLCSLGYSVETLHRIHQSNGIKHVVKRFLQDALQTKAAKFRKEKGLKSAFRRYVKNPVRVRISRKMKKLLFLWECIAGKE